MKVLWGARTTFSIGQSILSVDTLLAKAKELGYEAVAIADTMSVSALIDAAGASKKAGINLISGCTLRVQHWEPEKGVFQPKVYCRTGDAFVELLKALSAAEVDGKGRTSFTYLTFDRFIEMLRAADFVVTTGDVHSAFSSAFPAADTYELVERVRLAQNDAQSALAVELVAVENPYYERANEEAAMTATSLGLPVMVSGMCLYASPDDAEARDVMEAIAKNQKMTFEGRNILTFMDLSLKPADELERIAKTASQCDAIADSLSWRWSKMPISLPKMADDEFKALVGLCKAGWADRVGKEVMGYKPDKALLPEYVARLKMELDVLNSLGFCGYFLLVADLVTWAKKEKILVGPGRGSVGGSLVAYLTGITDVDPIRFNLLFERFINPERLDLPDADLDFMSVRRHEVVEYLRDKYGSECVAQISNYNTLGAPSALKEVGKAYEIPDRELACSSYIPKEHGQSVSLEEAETRMPELQEYAARHPDQFAISKKLEGAIRAMGTHAAGVIVAAVPIAERAVVEKRGEDGAVNWDKRVVEDMGLVKIDILGLTNLDVLGRAAAKIKADYGTDIDLLSVPLDDAKVMEAFGRGDTVGVFQFESGGMRKLLKDLAKGGTLDFEALSAATALFRPGPLDSGLLDDYVAIRQGAASEHYEHPNMKAALGPTFGVIVYQEQVMQLARDLAGFSLAGADHLRKAMGKKDKAKMAEQRDQWVKGCRDHSGIDEDWSSALFDKIELFAGYAFNRSHSVEYAIISYWTMWLKIHYPHAFYAAALEVFKEDKLHALVTDAAKHKIEILPPDINESTRDFRRTPDGHLMAPLNRVKGIGELTETAILDARAKLGRPFATVEELIDNVEKRRCNIRHRQILEDVGAFAKIIPGSLPPRHPDRTKTQKELLPGLVVGNVRADRAIVIDGHIKEQLTKLYLELRDQGAIVLPRFGKKPKLMVVFEAPTFHDEKAGKLMETDSAQFVKDALKAAGLSMADCYCTTYLKRPKEGKAPSNDEVLFSKPFFERELELVKPAAIVALGSFVVRQLLPDEKGGIMDMNGKVVYDKKLDASVVVGISPGMLYHDPGKQPMLDDAFSRAAELFS